MSLFKGILFLAFATFLRCVDVTVGHWYHVPYACSVLYDYGNDVRKDLIGSCSILNQNTVLVSVDNLNSPIPKSMNESYYQRLDKIVVSAGSNFMDPSQAIPPPPFSQMSKAKDFYVPLKPSFSGNSSGFVKNPWNLSEIDIVYDVFGVAFNAGFLVIEGFTISPFVRPIIVAGDKDRDIGVFVNHKLISSQESLFIPFSTCFAYTYSAAVNKMRYLEVTYVRRKDCLNAFCLSKLSKCTTFPTYEHLVCMKSTNYVDACPEARGAALFCDFVNSSVVGIISTAPLCGQYNTPGVYTTLPLVLEFFKKVFNKPFIDADYINKGRYSLEDNAQEQWADLH